MFTGWVLVTFLAGLALQLWFVQKLVRFVLESMTRAQVIMRQEQRTRIARARAEEGAYLRGEVLTDDTESV